MHYAAGHMHPMQHARTPHVVIGSAHHNRVDPNHRGVGSTHRPGQRAQAQPARTGSAKERPAAAHLEVEDPDAPTKVYKHPPDAKKVDKRKLSHMTAAQRAQVCI